MSKLEQQFEAAQRAADFLESSSDREPHERQATPQQCDDLRILLKVIAMEESLTDEQFETLFETEDSVDMGLAACDLLARNQVAGVVPDILQFYTWFITTYAGDFLSDADTEVLGHLEPEAAVELIEYAIDPSNNEEVQATALDGVKQLAMKHPEIQPTLEPLLIEGLNQAEQRSARLNSYLMMIAVDCQMTESAEPIERAFSQNQIDCGMMGDWEMVRKLLHVEGLGLPMPEKPFSSLVVLRKNLGVGVFSEEPLFMMGELQEEAFGQYLENACSAFSRSTEGQQLLPEGHYPHDVHKFLELAAHYLCVNVENMTPGDAEEILLEIYPRKVSMEPDRTDEVIEEVEAFWRFCDRVHELEHASEIAQCVADLADGFERVMNDPSNFGMAKGFFMAGMEAGYDMTTQEGLNAFTMVYNASLTANRGLPGIGGMPPTSQVNTLSAQPPAPSLSLKKRKKLLAKKMKKRKKK